MALWHHLRRTGLQQLIPNYQSLSFPLLPTRSFAVPAYIKAKQEQEEQHGPRLNEAITAQRLRLVTDEGHSIVTRWEALEKAKRLNLDLVEVQRDPPVCKIMDFHKEKFKQVTKEKERTKNKALRIGENKEVRVNGKTELKDLKMKAETIIRLMERGYRVKCTALPVGKEVRASKDDFLPKAKAKEKSSARKSGKEEDLLENDDENKDLSAIETEEYWAKKKLKQEALLGTLTHLLSLIDDVAIVESGPHVVGTKQAYIIVRHSKFETKKSGKKGVKPLEVLTNIQSSGPNKPVAVDNKDQPEEWEIEESDSENDRVDIKKIVNNQKPSISKSNTEPLYAENRNAKASSPEVKIDPSLNENRYAKQNQPNRYQLNRPEKDGHPQIDPRQRPDIRNGTDGHTQFDPRRRQFNERDAHVQFDPKQRQHNGSSNGNFSSPRSNAFVNEIRSKPPVSGGHNDKYPASPIIKPHDPSPSTLNIGKFNAPPSMAGKSTADENKNSSSPTKSYGIFSRNSKT